MTGHPFSLVLGAFVAVVAAVPTGIAAQESSQSFAFTLATDSAELARVSELAQEQLTPPIRIGPLSGSFVSGRIYPFDGPGRFLVVGVFADDASGESWQVLRPFGVGLADAASHLLGPADETVEITRVGDLFDNGGFAVFFCAGSGTTEGVPTVVVFDGGWVERTVEVSRMWTCGESR